jgi:hypothetical protein
LARRENPHRPRPPRHRPPGALDQLKLAPDRSNLLFSSWGSSRSATLAHRGWTLEDHRARCRRPWSLVRPPSRSLAPSKGGVPFPQEVHAPGSGTMPKKRVLQQPLASLSNSAPRSAVLRSLSYLHEVSWLQRLAPRAAFGVEKVKQLLQGRRVCLVPEVCAFAPDGDQVFVLQLLKVMRKRGTWDRQFTLNVAYHHAAGIR